MRVLILLTILGIAFAFPQSAERIVGGDVTTIEEHPFMVNVQHQVLNIWWQQTCSAALLTSTHALSASSCFYSSEPLPLRAWHLILGTSLRSGVDGTVSGIAEIRLHERYSPVTEANNIAIVRLSVRAVFSPSIQAARIPSTTFTLPDGTDLVALGYGTLTFSGVHSEHLRQVGVRVINRELCATRYAYLQTVPGFENTPRVTADMMCTGMQDIGGRGFCTGDAGGPVTYQGDILYGIASWGYRCGDPTYVDVNTHVAFFSNWIIDNAS